MNEIPSPSESATDSASEVRPHGMVATVISLLRQPVATIRHVVRHPAIGSVLLLLILSSAVNWLLQSAAILDRLPEMGLEGEAKKLAENPETMTLLRQTMMVFAVFIAPLFSVSALVMVSGAIRVTCSAFGSLPSYRSLFAGIGFAALPSILTSFLAGLLAFTGPIGSGIGALLSLMGGLGAVALGVLVIREATPFTLAKSSLVYSISLLILTTLLMLFVGIVGAPWLAQHGVQL